MNVVISESVRQAGFQDVVLKASKLFPKVIARSLLPHTKATWEVFRDPSNTPWLVVAVEYDGTAGQASERDLFEPAELDDQDGTRERFEWLWNRVLREAMKQRTDADAESVLQFTDR